MTLLLLVRHGATEWNSERRFLGRTDVPMSPDGFDQAEKTAEQLSNEPISAIYSSPLIRARETATRIAHYHQLPLEIEPDLVEIDQGDWEGLRATEIRKRWPELTANGLFVSRPGGETLSAVRRRALRSLSRIVKAVPSKTVAVVSHQAVIRIVSASAVPANNPLQIALGPGQIARVQAHLSADGILSFQSQPPQTTEEKGQTRSG